MDLEEIKKILDLMRDNDLSEFELERDNVKLRLTKHASGGFMVTAPPATHASASHTVPAMSPPASPPAAGTPVLSPADNEVDLAVVKSPIVGTFYRAPEPGARPFAEVFPEQAKKLRAMGGRPKLVRPKMHIGFRLAADVVDGIRATGKGYNARVERVLRDALAQGKL